MQEIRTDELDNFETLLTKRAALVLRRDALELEMEHLNQEIDSARDSLRQALSPGKAIPLLPGPSETAESEPVPSFTGPSRRNRRGTARTRVSTTALSTFKGRIATLDPRIQKSLTEIAGAFQKLNQPAVTVAELAKTLKLSKGALRQRLSRGTKLGLFEKPTSMSYALKL